MPQVKLTVDCVIAGQRYSAGDVVTVEENDLSSLIPINRAQLYAAPQAISAPAPKPAAAGKPKPTKAQLLADLAAIQAAEAQIQADVNQAAE